MCYASRKPVALVVPLRESVDLARFATDREGFAADREGFVTDRGDPGAVRRGSRGGTHWSRGGRDGLGRVGDATIEATRVMLVARRRRGGTYA